MSASNRRLRSPQSAAKIEASEDRIFKYFVSYALLLLFIVVSVLSTTDLQLLQIKQGVALPFISANTSISGFYLISSMIVCAASIFMAREFHNLEVLKRRGNHGSTFVFSSANRRNQTAPLFGVDGCLDQVALDTISRLVFFVSGPAVAGLLLFRFADFQDRTIFAAQLALAVITTHFAVVYSRRTDQLYPSPKSIGWRIVVRLGALLVIAKLVLCVDVIYLPPQHSLSFMLKRHTVLLNEQDGGTISLVPHIKIDRSEAIWTSDVSKQAELAYQNGSRDVNSYFLSRGMSIDLRGRRLRFLDIPFQIAPRIWAHDADLSGANLSYSKLAGSNFIGTSLYAANLSMASLDGARFANTDLNDTDWANTRARGAFFDNAHFRHASLIGTKFTGSLFFDTTISESYVHSADFNAVTFADSAWKDNIVLLKPKATVFESKPSDENTIDDYAALFNANDDEAIAALTREFCVDNLTGVDAMALDTLAASYTLLYPSRPAKVLRAFDKDSCPSAKSAWARASGRG